jgi:uncharacterized protein YecE (DUF72 family)
MATKHKILVGTAGFSYKDWEGVVYPKDLKKRKVHPLEYLAQYFDCCEINTSFYGHIRPEIGSRWCAMVAAVNPQFRFTAKLNQAFTHAPNAAMQSTSAATLRPTPEDERLARAGLDSLAGPGLLGALLVQFPISFKNTLENDRYLTQLLERFSGYPLVVEVRHMTWNNPAVLSQLAEQHIGFVNIDQPLLGKAMRPTDFATASNGYIRLHGRNYKDWCDAEGRSDRYNYLYKTNELEGWVEKIKTVSDKAKETFVITNNHPAGRAAVNALELINLLTHQKLKVPEALALKYPELQKIAEQAPLRPPLRTA